MPEFRLDADAFLPAVERQHNDLVAPFQVHAIMSFTE
jgi:hypothetical protein